MTVINMNCVEGMRMFPDAYFDSIVCDPPYELGFMGKSWDASGIAYSVEMWTEALRVLKPGGHLLAFSGSRTYHRMVCAIEDAGFEIRDQIMWVYGSGFPKSLDVSKAIDKARDDSSEILRVTSFVSDAAERAGISRAAVDAAMGTSDMAGWWLSRLKHRCQCPKWDQWLQLKVVLSMADDMDAEVWRLNGRKGTPGEAWNERDFYDTPTGGLHGGSGNTVGSFTGRQAKPGGVTEAARQWQGWGTALKPAHEPIVVARKPLIGTVAANVLQFGTGAINVDGCRVPGWKPQVTQGINSNATSFNVAKERQISGDSDEGRWPANLIHDGSDEVLAAFPQDAGRFYYAAKCSKKDRNEGLDDFTARAEPAHRRTNIDETGDNPYLRGVTERLNTHPTVKPTDLMRYLCRLVTPPGGTVLDPFAGSGSTGKAAKLEGFSFIGFELSEEYTRIAIARIVGVNAP